MYSLLKKLLFLFSPEFSHSFSLNALKLAHKCKLVHTTPSSMTPKYLLGLNFSNGVGLAAGLDKNAEYIDSMAALGFGFIEIGTVTPKPQVGNPKPRLFRLSNHQAIINRMGFNNLGADQIAKNIAKSKYKGTLGINIGKNKDTPNDAAAADYLYCFKKLWPYASYITINISSPNTKNLRDLQSAKALSDLLIALKNEQHHINKTKQRYIPLFVKIAPDLNNEEIKSICHRLIATQMDGVIATNTSIGREDIAHRHRDEQGGLSGQPLSQKSTQIIIELRKYLPSDFPIIASGGVMDKQSAQAKLAAGANLLQVYTGFIYKGPSIIKELAEQLQTFKNAAAAK